MIGRGSCGNGDWHYLARLARIRHCFVVPARRPVLWQGRKRFLQVFRLRPVPTGAASARHESPTTNFPFSATEPIERHIETGAGVEIEVDRRKPGDRPARSIPAALPSERHACGRRARRSVPAPEREAACRAARPCRCRDLPAVYRRSARSGVPRSARCPRVEPQWWAGRYPRIRRRLYRGSDRPAGQRVPAHRPLATARSRARFPNPHSRNSRHR